MSHRPYPNRDRAFAQMRRHKRPRPPWTSPVEAFVAYLRSDEGRDRAYRRGEQAGRAARATLADWWRRTRLRPRAAGFRVWRAGRRGPGGGRRRGG